MPDKEFKTYRQLLTILRDRGMSIGKGTQGSHVMRILEKENYYNVSIANFSVLGLARDASGSYPSGINDVYAIAVIFAMILSKMEIREFVTLMKTAFAKLAKQLHTISIDDVMQTMGYSNTWGNLVNLR